MRAIAGQQEREPRTPAPMWRAYSSSSSPSETSGSDASAPLLDAQSRSFRHLIREDARSGRKVSLGCTEAGAMPPTCGFLYHPHVLATTDPPPTETKGLFTMDTKLTAERRSDAGKGVARKLRAAGKVPAVLYGQGLETTPLTVDSRELTHLLHGSAGSNVLVDLVVDGEEHLAIPREIQRDHIHRSGCTSTSSR